MPTEGRQQISPSCFTRACGARSSPASGKAWTFWLYAILTGFAVIFARLRVPETKGRPLEQIDSYWQHERHWPSGSTS